MLYLHGDSVCTGARWVAELHVHVHTLLSSQILMLCRGVQHLLLVLLRVGRRRWGSDRGRLATRHGRRLSRTCGARVLVCVLQALVLTAGKEMEPCRPVLAGVLIMISQSVHVLVSPLTVAHATRKRPKSTLRFPLNLPQLTLANRVIVIAGSSPS